MAASTSTDFFDDLKGYTEALLVGSFAFGSVFPLALKTISDHFPGIHSSTVAHVRLFYIVYLLYFVVPVLLGLIAWWLVSKNSRDDVVFVDDFLRRQGVNNWWYHLLRWGPLAVLGLLAAAGVFILWPWGGFFHGPVFMLILYAAYWALTVALVAGAYQVDSRLLKTRNSRFHRHTSWGIRAQGALGLVGSVGFFSVAYFSFFMGHEHEGLFSSHANDRDRDLSIEMPFQWQQTARFVDTVCVKPIEKSFGRVAEQANLLAATSLDYNDLVLRQMPDPRFAWKVAPGLQRSAFDVRRRFIAAYDTATVLANRVYVGSDSLQRLLDALRTTGAVDTLRRHCDLLKAQFPRTADSASTDSLRLVLANQLMPLTDNLAEAAGSIRAVAENQSRVLLAEWVKITRLKGLFLLFCYLNVLIFGWFVIRLAQEVRARNATTAIGNGLKRNVKINPANAAPPAPKPFRELTNLKYFLSLTVLLILPLFRTVDEKTVSADQPFWFLDLPKLLGSVVQPLPNGYNLPGNHEQNREVVDRLDAMTKQVDRLENAALKLQKTADDTRNQQQYR